MHPVTSARCLISQLLALLSPLPWYAYFGSLTHKPGYKLPKLEASCPSVCYVPLGICPTPIRLRVHGLINTFSYAYLADFLTIYRSSGFVLKGEKNRHSPTTSSHRTQPMTESVRSRLDHCDGSICISIRVELIMADSTRQINQSDCSSCTSILVSNLT